MQQDTKNRIKWIDFYFFPWPPARYRIDIEWYSGDKWGFNVYDSDYWCERLREILGVNWKADMDFFSCEHIDEAQSKIWRLLGRKAGIKTSKKGFQYLILL